MALWDLPPHSVTSYTASMTRDAGGGTTITYTSAQATIPCSINTASANTIEMYAQNNIQVNMTVAFLSSILTTALSPGMKLVSDDTSQNFRIEGIRKGRAYGSVPAFVYADCSLIL